MMKTYFKVALRNLLRNSMLSFINISGLAVGMSFAILIGLWIQYEKNFDSFHTNIDRIAMVQRNTFFNNQKNTENVTMLPLYDELKNNYPEIKRLSRVKGNGSQSLMLANKKFKKSGYYVDPDFLEMLTIPVISGNTKTGLNDLNSIILTESVAEALFGKLDPIGKTLKVDNEYNMQVTAVVRDAEKNSSLQYDFLAPFAFLIQHNDFAKRQQSQWGMNFLITLLEIKEGASLEELSKKLAPLLIQKNEALKDQSLRLYPMRKWRLFNDFKDWNYAGGRIEYVRLFGIIGIFVLFIACINFMNLSTARSEKRAKEVGIRKTVGSSRRLLIIQFLVESMLTAFFSFLLSLLLVLLLLPFVKDLGFENIPFDVRNMFLWATLLIVCLVTGLISGSYPALYLSSFAPVKVLKGYITQGRGAVNFRKTLVIAQFTISVGLIISTIIVYQQIAYAKNRGTGYDPKNLIVLDASKDLAKNYEALKHDLLSTGYIEAISKANSPMTEVNNSFIGFNWKGKDPNAQIVMDVIMTEWDYDKTARLNFTAGRAFSPEYKTDSNAVILNEAALNTIGYKDPIGKTITFDNKPLTIVGIIENVLMSDPFKPVFPAVIFFNPLNANMLDVIFIRLKDKADLKKSLAAIQPIVEKHNPALPFEYKFTDEEFEKKFATETLVANISGIFAVVAIFISCLGLFGLSMFMAEKRSKEISIRKVLGASLGHIWLLLSKEFTWLVMIAWLIASPVTWWLMQVWLEKYEYHIHIDVWVFGIAGTLAILISFITVSTQAIRAAVAKPIKKLRSE